MNERVHFIVKRLLFAVVIVLVYLLIVNYLIPMIFGSQIDRKMLRSVDVDKIAKNYAKFEHHEEEDTIEIFFNSWHNQYILENVNGDISVILFIYPEKRFNKFGSIKNVFGFTENSYDNMLLFKKDNIEIYAYEITKDIRSKEIQKALENILKELEAI